MKAAFTLFILQVSMLLPAQSLTTAQRNWSYLTGSTVVAKDSIWDEPADFPLEDQLIDLGFPFQAYGKNLDSVWLDQGGILSLDQEVWVGIWEDLCDRGFGGRKPLSPISIKHSSVAGVKRVEIEWRNFGFYGDFETNGRCTDSANVRMTISENQTIELWFGPSHITSLNTDFPSGVVIFADRLDSLGNATGIDLTGDPANPQTAAVNEKSHGNLSAWPANGQVYTFDFKQNRIADFSHKSGCWYADGVLHQLPGVRDVQLYSTNGKLIAQYNQAGEIELSELNSGVYLVRFTDNTGSFSFKIIK